MSDTASKPCRACGKLAHNDIPCDGWPSPEDLRIAADDHLGDVPAWVEQAVYRSAHQIEALWDEIDELKERLAEVKVRQ